MVERGGKGGVIKERGGVNNVGEKGNVSTVEFSPTGCLQTNFPFSSIDRTSCSLPLSSSVCVWSPGGGWSGTPAMLGYSRISLDLPSLPCCWPDCGS